ncbi:hypothetical protein E3N88_24113 [Mikania micrantha]|uniref:Uncharacterized protein n=1 Tax=Mikania micrantha TaxID=192012 RepID=A0A5N6NF71_9ASTR|nr:hypothetical protein E3N88_24113 [Mikania micrantha]
MILRRWTSITRWPYSPIEQRTSIKELANRHFARECKSSSTQPSTSGQPHQRPSSSPNSANVAEQDFSDWSFQAEDASISNSALMANHSTSSFKGEKYEKLFRMSDTAELVNKRGAGLGYNKVDPPSAYTPMVEIRCKPEFNLVYDDVLDIHKVAQNDDLSDLNPSNSTCSDEDDTPINLEKEKPALKIKKRNKKIKKHSSVFVKAKYAQTGSTSSDDYVTCPSDKSKRGRSKERKAIFSGLQKKKEKRRREKEKKKKEERRKERRGKVQATIRNIKFR